MTTLRSMLYLVAILAISFTFTPACGGPDPRDETDGGSSCVGKADCVDPCDNVSCGETQYCLAGQCIEMSETCDEQKGREKSNTFPPMRYKACEGDLVCNYETGLCVVAPRYCSPEPPVEWKSTPRPEPFTCPEGQICAEDGVSCEDPPVDYSWLTNRWMCVFDHDPNRPFGNDCEFRESNRRLYCDEAWHGFSLDEVPIGNPGWGFYHPSEENVKGWFEFYYTDGDHVVCR